MPINIVTPHPGALIEPATSAATAHLTDRGGPVLKAAEVSAVYLGDNWARADTNAITAFLKVIVPSSYLDSLAEYNVGHGSFVGEFFLPLGGGPPPPPPPPPPPVPGPGCLGGLFGMRAKQTAKVSAVTTIDDLEIQRRLNAAITAGTLPAKTAESLYLIFVESGVTVTMQGSASCAQFCGYHSDDGNGTYYGVLPNPGCAGCMGTLDTFQALTSVTTHELAEAVTDPVPGTGWYDDANGEIGDICAWSTYTLDGYVVQKEWYNSKGACA